MRFPALIEPLADKLRGEHKSMRYRFWSLPNEWIKYGWYRLTGRSWIDFYRERMDGMQAHSLDTPAPASYIDEAKEHFDFLLRNNLKPTDVFLDYGCGILRLGKQVIPFLNRGHYIGIEIAAMRLEKGRRLLAKSGIDLNASELLITADCHLRELGTKKFDVVWAKSVFTHMPEADIRVMLAALKKHLKSDAVFYFTFTPSDKPRRSKIKDFFYPEEHMRMLLESSGYTLEVMPDWPIERFGDLMGRARLQHRS